MMKPEHVLGLLPARGGSKGIKNKNIRPLLGQPLITWAANALLAAKGIARAICSTDCPMIAEHARSAGLETPWLRPPELSGDTAMVTDVLLHALDELEDPNHPYTHIVLVQATTPTVMASDIEQGLELIRQGANTVISGFLASSQHPSLMYTVDEQQQVHWLFDKLGHSARRQDFPPIFVRTGLVYIVDTNTLRHRHSLYGDIIKTLIVDEQRAVTIDEEQDFIRAEQLMETLYGRPKR